jgi:hypothetical protein
VIDSGSMAPLISEGECVADVRWRLPGSELRLGSIILVELAPLICVHRAVARRRNAAGDVQILQLGDSDETLAIPRPNGYLSPWVAEDRVLGTVIQLRSPKGKVVYDASAPLCRLNDVVAQWLDLQVWRLFESGMVALEQRMRGFRSVLLKGVTAVVLYVLRHSATPRDTT